MASSDNIFKLLGSLSTVTNLVIAGLVIYAFYKTIWGFKDDLGQSIPGLVRVRNFLVMLIMLGAITEVSLLKAAYNLGKEVSPMVVSIVDDIELDVK
ncbi:hypothetical protein [Laceyella putida]|uniref:Uncharacterized protein n=1 Tax=Laceyella putida TaxID=110101 RepID=A0ABW2RR29_9BACL